ncbi:hypothetical protein GJ496_010242 [Pomphorhynchus laevis]|nr:hypothetical protein GJ496_010242 [Pomphorhynchus laevis]
MLICSILFALSFLFNTVESNGPFSRLRRKLKFSRHLSGITTDAIPHHTSEAFSLRRNLQTYRENAKRKLQVSKCKEYMKDEIFRFTDFNPPDLKEFCVRYNSPKLLMRGNGSVVVKATEVQSGKFVQIKLIERTTSVLCMQSQLPSFVQSMSVERAKFKLEYKQVRMCGGWDSIDNLDEFERDNKTDNFPQALELYVLKKLSRKYKNEEAITAEFVNQHRLWTSGYTVLVTRYLRGFMTLNEKAGLECNKGEINLDMFLDERLLIRNLIHIVGKLVSLQMFPLDLSGGNVLINRAGDLLLKELNRVDVNFERLNTRSSLAKFFSGDFSVGWKSKPCVDMFPPEIYYKTVSPYNKCTDQNCYKYIPSKYFAYQMGAAVCLVNHCGRDDYTSRDAAGFYEEHDSLLSSIAKGVLEVNATLADHANFLKTTMLLRDVDRIGIKEVLTHKYFDFDFYYELPKNLLRNEKGDRNVTESSVIETTFNERQVISKQSRGRFQLLTNGVWDN